MITTLVIKIFLIFFGKINLFELKGGWKMKEKGRESKQATLIRLREK